MTTKKTRILTGITTTGTPHLGNYVGAIRPAVAASQDAGLESFFFLADLHALIKCQDPLRVARSTREIAATWLALGLDTENALFYRQSDVPEISELTWVLTCMTSKGLMNRAHAYKAAVDANQAAGKEDLDDGVTMGLYSYPILMAADILMFNAEKIPVGKDQIQHIEMARDIAGRFNHAYEPLFQLPEPLVEAEPLTIPGLDGRKMSKSYDNTLPLFAPRDELQRLVRRILTDSRQPGEPKGTDNTLYSLYALFADAEATADFARQLDGGMAWGEAKDVLFERLDEVLAEPRARYEALMEDLGQVEHRLQEGARRARDLAAPLLHQVKRAVGIRPLDQALGKPRAEAAKKGPSPEETARIQAGRRRAILIQVQPVLDEVRSSPDPAARARTLIEEREQALAGLKKKARQKAENELEVLREELESLL